MKKLLLTLICFALIACIMPASFLAQNSPDVLWTDIESPQEQGEGQDTQSEEGADGQNQDEPIDPQEPPAQGEAGGQEGESAQKEQEKAQRLAEIVAEREIMALVYLSDEYIVRSEAGAESTGVVTVESGQQVFIQNIVVNENYETWAHVSLHYNETEYAGYIQRENLATSDERFLQWEQEYATQSRARMARVASADYSDIQQFPESYRASLIALKNAHPNWTFVKQNAKHDWNTTVSSQMNPNYRSLVQSSEADYMKNGVYAPYGSSWYIATDIAVRYYMDPRNWLTEAHIFQFEQLTYNASYHNEGAVQSILNNSFMAGEIPFGEGRSYANVFYGVGAELGVSPYHLACRAYFEQGAAGTSALISGTYPGYEGYYNYYNVSASGNNYVVNGLDRARREGWTTPFTSIYGGAKIISNNYILAGQDTLYLQKFNVGVGNYGHQYQQALHSPSVEGKKIMQAYKNVGAINNTFVFKIPVFENMPATPCGKPESSYDVTLTPPAGYTDSKIYLDGVEYAANNNGGSFTVTAPGGGVTTASMYKYNDAGVPVGMYSWLLNYSGGRYNAVALSGLEDLLTYHGFSVRITGKAGIRFKSGISADLRSILINGGLDGYSLVECGTLVMTNANRSKYPFILGGTKVNSGIAYGINSAGTKVDYVYETIDGRHRFTSVLVGLPANQYKTDFAFRGYVVLTKDGSNVVLYGPPVARNIYSLSQQALATGQYAEGTSAYNFLNKILSDAK